jgi:hypothetical protein
MSYIRCLSNPEGLYIWGNTSDQIMIAAKDYELVTMPKRAFVDILKKWIAAYGNDEDRCNVKSGASLTLNKDHRWELFYKGWPRAIPMWETTLMYIVTQNTLEY